MKEKIFNNFSLKILSVLCAIVLWAVIVNIYDPTTSVTISNVNVELCLLYTSDAADEL